jgi:predicted nucleic acid-binding Zn ribbon protein
MSDCKPLFCQKCGAENTLEKQIVHTAFQLDGGGWYAQGYMGGGSKKSSSET